MRGGTINLFKVRGIQLAVHATFLLLVGYFAYEGWVEEGVAGALWSVAALLAFFVCIVLHELGHCLTALRYGIATQRILLTPIGGIAELGAIPREPCHELIMTMAGPAVNFAIAAILGMVISLPPGWPWRDADYAGGFVGFAQIVLSWNLMMGTFNLLPAFPMDGGRILRALLATRLTYVNATFVAATVGKVVCLAGIAWALLFPRSHFSGSLTAFLFAYIFLAGNSELRAVRRHAAWEKIAPEPPLLVEPSLGKGLPTLSPDQMIN